MKIIDFINPLLKWWWLIVISTGIAIITSYWVVQPLPPVYLAHTTLMVGRAIADPNPTGNEFGLAQQLAIYYTNIAMREPVRDATKLALGLDDLPKFSANNIPNAPFIEISVTDTDPERAMIVVNELARQLILQSPTAPQKEDIERQDFLNQQLAQIQAGIIETQKLIEQKQFELAELSSATQIEDTQAEITALESKLTLLQNNYIDLLSNTQSGAINTLSIIEVATLPVTPIGPNKILIIGLAGIAGLAFSVGVAYLLEFLDRTIKSPEDVNRTLEAPVLGFVPKLGKGTHASTNFIDEPRSPFAEAFRVLRTNIGFASVETPIRTIMITGAYQADGKTTIATNLALALSQTDQKVILVDSDMRRPNIHKALNIPMQSGLSDAFQAYTTIPKLLQNSSLSPNLKILTAGKMPPNPAELLNSYKMDQILQVLLEEADIVVIDSPPLVIPDAVILASKVDGILLALKPGRVRYELATKLKEQIERSGSRLIGIIFNQVKRTDSITYTGYRYTAYGEDEKKELARWNTNPIFRRIPTAPTRNLGSVDSSAKDSKTESN